MKIRALPKSEEYEARKQEVLDLSKRFREWMLDQKQRDLPYYENALMADFERVHEREINRVHRYLNQDIQMVETVQRHYLKKFRGRVSSDGELGRMVLQRIDDFVRSKQNAS